MSRQLRTSHWTRTEWATSGIIAAAFFAAAATAVAADKAEPPRQDVSGEEIFRREWIANDPRSHGGDGLGPVFNDSSCVACHNLGGVGGAGPVNKNVSLLTAVLPTLKQLQSQPAPPQAAAFDAAPNTTLAQVRPAHAPRPAVQTQTNRLKAIEQRHTAARQALIKLHPDFKSSATVVIHRFGNSNVHETWRRSILVGASSPFSVSAVQPAVSSPNQSAFTLRTHLGAVVEMASTSPQFVNAVQVPSSQPPATTSPVLPSPPINQPFPATSKIQSQIQLLKHQARRDLSFARSFQTGVIQHSQRNTTALFGAGLIDAIPTAAIEAAASQKYKDFPNVTGRIHRLQDNKIGRFGWKAQEASLYDFTMTACAVEVGLHVPDHSQSTVPYQSKKNVKPTGFDLNRQEVGALVDYLKLLPRPVQNRDSHPAVAVALSEGEQLFTSVGCTACHTKKLGDVDALFSDLLLHDMGPDLGSVGSYGVPTPSPEPAPLADAKTGKPKPVPPSAQEWRTPPLWGLRDSAPYLHDGRAASLEQAIAFHGGEAADARLRFFMQPHKQRQKIITFLKSLTAPDNTTAQR